MSRGSRRGKSRVICIAGMHRSGTSMVARLLNLCGVYLGPESEMLPANQANEAGYWENATFVELNDEILWRLGTGWDLPVLPPEGWERLPEMIPLRARATTLIQEFNSQPLWGWKDPRNSITLPFWKLLVPNLKVVVCLRNPLEVAQSLTRRGATSQVFGFNLWTVYYQRLLAETTPQNRVVTHYESYFHDSQAELRRLLQALSVPASEELIEGACQSVLASARHNIKSTDDILSSGIPSEVLQHYMDLCAEAGPVYLQLFDNQTDGQEKPEESFDPLRQRYENAFRELRYEKSLVEKEAAIKELRAELSNTEKALEELREVNRDHSAPDTSDRLESTEGYAQLFMPTSSGHEEEASCREKIGAGQWVKLSFAVNLMDRDAPVPLRFDPIDQVGVVEIAGLKLISEVDGSTIWHAANKEDFDQLEMVGPAVRLPASRVLRIFSYGKDPQVYFPKIAGLGSLGPVRFEVWLRFEPALKYLADGLNRFTSELHESKTALQTALKRNEEREAELNSHVELLGAAQRQLAALEETGSSKDTEIEHLHAVLTEREETVAVLRDTIHDRDAAIRSLRHQLTQMERSASDKDKVIARIQNKLEERDEALSTVKEAVRHLQAPGNEALNDASAELRVRLEPDGSSQQIVAAVESLRAALENAHIETDHLQDELTRMKRDLAQSVSQCEQAKKARELILSSCSWRVTAPFRKVHSLLSTLGGVYTIRRSRLFDAGFYRKSYPGMRFFYLFPLIHYTFWGWRERRQPCPLFDTGWYLDQNIDVATGDLNPLVHYLRQGWREGRNPHPLFDTLYYLKNNPDVARAKTNPLKHYVRQGYREGRNPSAKFDTTCYYQSCPDLREAGLNPLVHYVTTGWIEGRKPHPDPDGNLDAEPSRDGVGSAFSPEPHHGSISIKEGGTASSGQISATVYDLTIDEVVFEKQVAYPNLKSDIKLIAYYLPQFHPIPENDRWWGKGFTEWTNVVKAKPLFKGHHQPKLPGPLGFYDLRLPEVMREQVKLAQQHGVYGFCFHHYWFAGNRLLERPLEQFLADSTMDFPFCLCWANENWTRRWDGMEDEVLIAQDHSPEDDIEFIRDAMRYLKDPRYIRVNGKPLLIVYRPAILPCASDTVRRWRKACEQEGFGLYLVAAQTFGSYDPRPFSFDAAVQFPPHNIYFEDVKKDMLVSPFDGHVWSYYELSRRYMDLSTRGEYTLFRCVAPGWDNTARRSSSANVFSDNTPRTYGNWLQEACLEAAQVHPPESRFVFVNAWNEWAEGAYLEPDRKFGYAYLNVTGKVLLSSNSKHNQRHILFVGNDAFPAGAQTVLLHLIRWLQEHTNWKAHLMLLGDGALLSQYEELLPVRVADLSLRREELLQEIKDFCGRVDLVYGNTAVAAKVYDVLQELHVPIVTHVHELEASLQRFAGAEVIDLMRRHTRQYIAPSAPVLDNLVRRHNIHRDRVHVVHAFIQPTVDKPLSQGEKLKRRQELGLPADGKIVFGCGTPDWRKGPDLFVEVARRFREQERTDVYFCWIGSGTDGRIADPETLIKQYKLADQVFMLGFKPDPKQYFLAGDVFLLSSREDPFPLVCLEAAECGLPIVCFDGAGGMPGFVGEEAGFVVPHGDIEAMSDRLMRLLDDDALRREMGLAARHKLLCTHISDVEVPRICSIIGRAISSKEVQDIKAAGRQPQRRVSVIVPNYNYAGYLPGRIDSVLRQTCPVEEIIILDDASTDDSVTVIRELIGGIDQIPVIFIRNQVNSGSIFQQWKKGVELAVGDIIWIAEADDLAEPEFLERLLPYFDNDRVILAYAESKQIDENGHPIAEDYRYYTDSDGTGKWDEDYVSSGKDELKTVLAVKNTILNGSAVVFRKGEYRHILEECTQFKVAGDWYFYANLLEEGDIAYCSESLNIHRRHQHSVTHTYKKRDHFEEICRMQDLIAERVPLNKSVSEAAKRYRCEVKQYLQI
jgi:glycosyltransferase involved in cell wall biosynthesis